MIEILLVIILVVVLIGMAVLFTKINSGSNQADLEAIRALQQQLGQHTNLQDEKFDRINSSMQDQQKILNDQLSKSNTSLQQQFSISQKNLKDYSTKLEGLAKEVTKFSETGKNIQGFAEQLQSLENILKNPKQRGVLGEYYLETVLKNVLPPDSYSMQYKFENGEIVDAIVKVKDLIIPIDSKFSLENYNRLATAKSQIDRKRHETNFKNDLKKRIDETSKYIRPQENTVDFAFMFIPADGLYYDLLVQKVGAIDVDTIGLVEYAFNKRVILVSPTTFFAYLQTVLQGLRALQIEEQAKDIQSNVRKLQSHLIRYEDYMSKLGKHLGTTVGAYNFASKEFKKIDKDVVKVSGGESIELAVDELDKPTSVQE